MVSDARSRATAREPRQEDACKSGVGSAERQEGARRGKCEGAMLEFLKAYASWGHATNRNAVLYDTRMRTLCDAGFHKPVPATANHCAAANIRNADGSDHHDGVRGVHAAGVRAQQRVVHEAPLTDAAADHGNAHARRAQPDADHGDERELRAPTLVCDETTATPEPSSQP